MGRKCVLLEQHTRLSEKRVVTRSQSDDIITLVIG